MLLKRKLRFQTQKKGLVRAPFLPKPNLTNYFVAFVKFITT